MEHSQESSKGSSQEQKETRPEKELKTHTPMALQEQGLTASGGAEIGLLDHGQGWIEAGQGQ